jgi:Uma2 family endonuclease
MKVKDAAVAYATKKKIYTYQDYLSLPDDGKRYQLINGELIMSPAPIPFHQDVSRNIEFDLIKFLEIHPCGKVYDAPIDIVLSETNVLQPDIIFISKDHLHLITETNITGAPDLVIEILSPGTAYYDLIEKKDLYGDFGVREYWIVDPKKKNVEVYLNRDGKFALNQKVEGEGVVKSVVVENYKIDLNEIFKK